MPPRCEWGLAITSRQMCPFSVLVASQVGVSTEIYAGYMSLPACPHTSGRTPPPVRTLKHRKRQIVEARSRSHPVAQCHPFNLRLINVKNPESLSKERGRFSKGR